MSNLRLLKMTFLCAGLALPAAGQGNARAFVGARLLPISGPPIEDGVLLVRDGRIEAIGSRAQVVLPAGVPITVLGGKTVMPGLVDTHSHVGGGWGADNSAPIQPGVRMLEIGRAHV